MAHDRLLARAVEPAAQIAEVPATTMTALRQIYVSGSAAVTGPALAAERTIAGAQALDTADIKYRYAEVSERNRRQMS